MATQPRLANKQYNTPIGLYSQQNVQEVLQREQQILANGAIGIDFNNPAVGKPANLQNSAVLRMLEEEENRRGGRAGAKRVAWPPPQEGVLDPADAVEHNAVQVQGGPQSYNQSPGLQQNNFSPQRAAPYQQTAQPSYRPLKPLDVSPVGIGSPLASPALNQSPQAYRPATPTKGWASVQSPVSTPSSQKHFGAPAQGYQSQPQYQPVSQPYQQPNQGYQDPGRQFGQTVQQQHTASQAFQQSKTAPYAWQEPGRQYTLKQQQSSVHYQQSQQYQTSSQQHQQSPQQYQQPPQQYQQPPQQHQQPPQQYQQPSQQYQQPSQQYQQSSQQFQQPSQQYQQPSQQYQQPGQQYLLLSEQYQSPQPQSQPAVPQYQSQSYAQPSTPQNQAPSRPVAAQAQAAPRPQPAKHVEPPPSTITLRKEAPVSQAPAPVYNAQPATATLKGGKHLRGDLKWPPDNVRERMAAEKAQLEELAKGPANRPPRNEKDYTRFFEAHALNDTYPGYKIPPGTQFFRPM